MTVETRRPLPIAHAVRVVRQRRVVVDRRVDVVRRLGGRVVVEGQPGHRARGLRGDHGAVTDRVVVAEPALGAERRVRAHARAPDVVDDDLEVGPAGDRRGRRDDELRREARLVGRRSVRRGRRAGRRVRVGRVDRDRQAGAVRERIGIVLTVRIARVGRLDLLERRRLAVDRDRGDGHVRARSRGARDAVLGVEVVAEVGQALRRTLRVLNVVARQEDVRDRVVDREDVGVEAHVAAVAELGPDARARLGERVRAGAAGLGLRGLRRGIGLQVRLDRFLAADRDAAADQGVLGRRGAAHRARVAVALGRTGRQVVVPAAQAGRERDLDAVVGQRLRGHADGRRPDDAGLHPGTHQAHRDLRAARGGRVVVDRTGERPGRRTRLQRAQCRDRHRRSGQRRGGDKPHQTNRQ